MPPRKNAPTGPKQVDAITHPDKRANLPTADAHEFFDPELEYPFIFQYPRPLYSPQLVWRGKEEQDLAEYLEVNVPPIYIQEKIDPRVIIENLRDTAAKPEDEPELTLFDTFDGLGELDLVDFYQHEANWSNRVILGDSLQVMASLAERERLRGKVQMIYVDPPYGIKFGSNWQMSARNRDVKDGKLEHATREVEQIKAFRDTWKDGISSYLTYLRDRLTVAKELLTESGSIFVQIGDENVHLVRALLDEVMGSKNFLAQIAFSKTTGLESTGRVASQFDYLLWYGKSAEHTRYHSLFERKDPIEAGFTQIELPDGTRRSLEKGEKEDPSLRPKGKLFMAGDLTKPGPGARYELEVDGVTYTSGRRWWGAPKESLEKIVALGRVIVTGNTLRYVRYFEDFPLRRIGNLWQGFGGATNPTYVVQTNSEIVQRCLLMTTDPGDLVLDPTCGSGTTAYIAEQWGRRWITCDTSRVALALARQRIMAAQFPWYLLADTPEGRAKEAEVSGKPLPPAETSGDIRHGFVYERVLHITQSSIANNPDIRKGMSRDEIDAAIKRHAEYELLYDRPYEDKSKVRVAGPFTVESLSPHRSLAFAGSAVDAEGARNTESDKGSRGDADFEQTVIANLRVAGIQNGRKKERLNFDSIDPYASAYIQAVGVRDNAADGTPKRVGISLGPQYGTVGPTFVKDAAREAIRSGEIDLLCVLAFAFDPQVIGSGDDYVTSEEGFDVAAERQLGKVPVLLVRMNADLVRGEELKKTGAGNLFTVFGEPDIELKTDGDTLRVILRGVDVYDPNTGELRSDDTDQIALWMIDTNYNGESFFVRHCYFTGGQDPYKRLKTALKADIDADAWASLNATESRPFAKPDSGRIAVKVINDYGDEVMKVFRV